MPMSSGTSARAAGPVADGGPAAPDWDGLADTLHEIIQAAIPCCAPTGSG
jgi:hypothetical protein